MTTEALAPEAAAEWRTVPAGDVGRFRGGSGFPLRFQGQGSGEVPFFKVSDMNLPGNGKYMTRANHYISEAVRKQLGATLFPAGSIVFAKVGAAVFLERKRILGQPSCIDNNMAALVLDPSRAHIDFVHQLLLTIRLGDLVSATALPALNGSDLASIPLSLPSTACQREVATVLERADALLGKLDQLIAKKRDLKQAAMQQLLTSRTRLPGFADVWRDVTIGDVADVKTGPFGSSLHESDYVDNGTPIITVEHLGERSITRQNLPMVSDEDCRRLRAYSLQPGDVVFSRVGSIDRNALVTESESGWLFSGRLLRVRVRRDGADPAFLSHQFHSEPFKQRVREVAVGQTMPSLNTQILRRLPVALPTLVEQRAIAQVLSEMDTELTALEARLEKTRQLKQGMMQALLTGRIRLV